MSHDGLMGLEPLTRWVDQPSDLGDLLLRDIAACWKRVSDAGGAVGFPFPPVDTVAVNRATEGLRASLSADRRLLVLTVDHQLAGWLMMELNTSPVSSHWAVLTRVQTDLPFRGSGLGRALMTEAVRQARELNLEQLHIAVRGGQDIERFYARYGWQEVGRWPAALRLGPSDDRDEVLMLLDLATP